MQTHPYLRAYLAGIFVPTLVLPLLLTVFIVARIGMQIPTPIEQVMIFPMAVVPSLFGLWNIAFQVSRARFTHPLGLHGAALPLLMAPIGALVASSLNVLRFHSNAMTWFQAYSIPYTLLAPGFLVAIAAYYLVWKYVVGFFNRMLGIA